MMIKSRFAPSPTGTLHIGSVRTALFAYLAAKHHGGQFILRIEDTDGERSTKASADAIVEGMAWLSLTPDEGPIYQSDRLARYKEVADQLLAKGMAYRCYCSKERLEALREGHIERKEKPRYDGLCRDKTGDPSTPHVIRFKTPTEGSVTFVDCVRGTITVENSELDDLVLVRQDGMPTYNFAVVIDDHDMGITHVVRGDDHINNTPRQLNLFTALGYEPPIYGHIPMILGEDGKRLSKRHGAVNVLEFREAGFLPEAMLNYLVRLGWSHGDQEIFSVQEMIALFDMNHLSHSPAAMNMQKLEWLNQHYMKALPLSEVTERARPFFEALGLNLSTGPALEDVVALQIDRAKTLKELAEASQFFYAKPVIEDEARPKLETPKAPEVLKEALNVFSTCEFEPDALKAAITTLCQNLGLKMGEVGPVLRVAITGTMHSPSLDKTMALLGREAVLTRLNNH
ncbi:MAG: glutamate--tRNA ligase [Gammaproteobacteria bacterium]